MTSEVARRHNVKLSGRGLQPMVFAHGFGCDQQMWRFVAPAFEDTHQVVLFDHVGCGGADSSRYDETRHASLWGYAEDVLALLEGLDLRDVVFVGHSVSATIGLLAAIRSPERFAQLVLVSPSPCYLNDPPDYVGGFERADIDGLIDMMDRNLLGWANFLAPLVMDSRNPEALTDELRASFCASDPYITRRFAMATFLSDHRADLAQVSVPSLVLQCSDDAIAPASVGAYMQAHLRDSHLHVLQAQWHCPHMTHAAETTAAIRAHLA
ncbi:MAG: alpha/beta fold hydrolase [Rubrivivax sp.]|jgi:sigma-B regulation protein RsbQ